MTTDSITIFDKRCNNNLFSYITYLKIYLIVFNLVIIRCSRRSLLFRRGSAYIQDCFLLQLSWCIVVSLLLLFLLTFSLLWDLLCYIATIAAHSRYIHLGWGWRRFKRGSNLDHRLLRIGWRLLLLVALLMRDFILLFCWLRSLWLELNSRLRENSTMLSGKVTLTLMFSIRGLVVFTGTALLLL